jgi:hypothetical protein
MNLETYMRLRSVLTTTMLLIFPLSSLLGQQPGSSALPPPTVTSANDGIFAAFQTHSLVALGDYHGLAEEEDFFAELVRDPRFASEVGNIVVEFGDAAEQETIDRFVSGEDVPYEQLRRVWANTVGWFPTVTAMGYLNFYAQVRAVNAGLPRNQQIHVWLGDPPVDWSKVTTRADLAHVADRNQYPSDLVKANLLAKKKKSLIIYGTGHLSGKGSLAALLEAAYPGSLFVVIPYFGFAQQSCSDTFEHALISWPTPALATPVRSTTLQPSLQQKGCSITDTSDFHFSPAATEAQKAEAIARGESSVSAVSGDALLYLGAATTLTQSPLSPDLYLDTVFRKEIGKRFQMLTGQSMQWPNPADNPMTPRFVRAYGRKVSRSN